MGIFKKRKLSDLNIKMPLKEKRKRAKILVIDDEETFPIDLLSKEGYNIQYWEKVESLRTLEEGEYDIIFLDIFDVAKDISKEDGLGVLEHLKKYNPGQIIIAYSGRSYDLNKTKFWRLADDTLAKPSDLVTCKEVIDKMLEDRFNIHYYWESLKQLLTDNNIDHNTITKLEDRLAKALRKGKKVSVAEFLPIGIRTTELIARIAPLANTIIKLASGNPV